MAASALFMFIACGFGDKAFEYHGTIDPANHGHLKGKRIFIDPGKSERADNKTTGPSGLSESEVNLKVAKILSSIFTKAGAKVELSRTKDRAIDQSDKSKHAMDFNPDVILVIRHSAGIPAKDGQNHPIVFIRGSRDNNPQSFDLAQILLDEFGKSFDKKGIIISGKDESDAHQLFFTENILCPEIAGHFGFIGDPDYESLLRDTGYNVAEAERYFTAVSEYFKRGIPSASMMTDEDIPSGSEKPSFKSNSPKLAIRIKSGILKDGATSGTISVSLNDSTVTPKKIDDQTYVIEYKNVLMPGEHHIVFSFRNGCFQSSPVYQAAFIIPFDKDGYSKSITEGKRLISLKKFRQGLNLLLPAFNAEKTDTETDTVVFAIAKAFDSLSDKKNAGKYYSFLYKSFPQSPLREKVPAAYRNTSTDESFSAHQAE